MDMVERVARAMALADLDEETRFAVDLDAHMAFVAEHYRELAIAAIEALREPTQDMADDAFNDAYVPHGDFRAGWRAGIASILKSTRETA
jgi:hypothetical protein